jgi:ribbon-helix-helix CopG family protein
MVSFELEDDLVERLKAVKDRDGIFVSEQLRRAVRMWLEGRGMASAPKKTKARRK